MKGENICLLYNVTHKCAAQDTIIAERSNCNKHVTFDLFKLL